MEEEAELDSVPWLNISDEELATSEAAVLDDEIGEPINTSTQLPALRDDQFTIDGVVCCKFTGNLFEITIQIIYKV